MTKKKGKGSSSKIRVTVIAGRDLPARGRKDDDCDPMVRVLYGLDQAATRVRHDTVNPDWNQTFEFAKNSKYRHISFAVYDRDERMNEFLGTVVVGVDKARRPTWFRLGDEHHVYPPKKGKAPRGEIKIKIDDGHTTGAGSGTASSVMIGTESEYDTVKTHETLAGADHGGHRRKSKAKSRGDDRHGGGDHHRHRHRSSKDKSSRKSSHKKKERSSSHKKKKKRSSSSRKKKKRSSSSRKKHGRHHDRHGEGGGDRVETVALRKHARHSHKKGSRKSGKKHRRGRDRDAALMGSHRRGAHDDLKRTVRRDVNAALSGAPRSTGEDYTPAAGGDYVKSRPRSGERSSRKGERLRGRDAALYVDDRHADYSYTLTSYSLVGGDDDRHGRRRDNKDRSDGRGAAIDYVDPREEERLRAHNRRAQHQHQHQAHRRHGNHHGERDHGHGHDSYTYTYETAVSVLDHLPEEERQRFLAKAARRVRHVEERARVDAHGGGRRSRSHSRSRHSRSRSRSRYGGYGGHGGHGGHRGGPYGHHAGYRHGRAGPPPHLPGEGFGYVPGYGMRNNVVFGGGASAARERLHPFYYDYGQETPVVVGDLPPPPPSASLSSSFESQALSETEEEVYRIRWVGPEEAHRGGAGGGGGGDGSGVRRDGGGGRGTGNLRDGSRKKAKEEFLYSYEYSWRSGTVENPKVDYRVTYKYPDGRTHQHVVNDPAEIAAHERRARGGGGGRSPDRPRRRLVSDDDF